MIKAERTPRGDLSLSRLPPAGAAALEGLPGVLETDDPRVRDRLLPRTYEDDALEREWRRVGVPELEHLFASRTRLIEKDLRSLAREKGGSFRLTIARAHESAWLSGLNAARHALFILSNLAAADMTRDLDEVEDPEKAAALYRIHLLAWIQELILRADAPPRA